MIRAVEKHERLVLFSEGYGSAHVAAAAAADKARFAIFVTICMLTADCCVQFRELAACSVKDHGPVQGPPVLPGQHQRHGSTLAGSAADKAGLATCLG